MSIKFKCNFCNRPIEVLSWAPEKIVCWCGATYTKTITATITRP